jgi:hypothetical protein
MHYNPDTRFLTFVARCMGHVSGHENTARLCAPALGSEDRRCNTRCIRVRAYGRCASATAPIADVRAQYSSQKGLPAVGMEVYAAGRQHIDGENSAELRNVFACVPRRLAPRLPVMMSARVAGPRLRLALARIFSEHWNSNARWHFSIRLETHSAVKQGLGHARAALQNKTWIGRVAFVEPGRKDLCLSTQSEGGL